jgi:hypothetical protein
MNVWVGGGQDPVDCLLRLHVSHIIFPKLARATGNSVNVPLGFLNDHESQRHTFNEYSPSHPC